MTAEKIAALLRQAANDDVELKLHSLIEAWRLKPAPELAAAIDGLEVPFYGLPAGADWVEVGEDCTEVQRAGLLRQLTGAIAMVAERLEAIDGWPRDPRIAAALQALLQRLPWTSLDAHRRVYQPAFVLLAKQGDPRSLQWISEVGERWTVGGKTATRLEKARAHAEDRLRGGIEGRDLALTETEVELIAEAVGTRAFRKGRADEEAKLLAQIHATPEDDGPRAVYADLLQERAEPWGEVIALQLTKDLTAPQSERLKKLQSTHWRRWCGTMTPFLRDPKFTRGFLSGGLVLLDQRTLPPPGPHWALFEDLTVSATEGPMDGLAEWAAAVRPHLTRLKALRQAPTWLAEALLPEGALALETVDACGIGFLKSTTRTVPHLVKAACTIGEPSDMDGLIALGRAPALREVSLTSEVPNVVTVAATVLSGTALELVSMDVDGCAHALSRGHDGKLSELWTGTGWARRHADFWAALPPDALTRLVLSHDVNPDEARGWFARQTRLERIDVGFSSAYATGGGPCGPPAQLRAAAAHWVVLSAAGVATVYDPKRLRPLLQQHLAFLDGAGVVSPDGRQLAGMTSTGMQVTRIGGGDVGMEFRQMKPIGFSDDGTRLWCADGELTTCLEVATRATRHTVRAPHRTLAIDRGDTVVLVDEAAGMTTVCGRDPEKPIRLAAGGIWAALSVGGRLATLDGDGQVRVADAPAAPMRTLGSPVPGARRVAISPDGRRVAVGTVVLDVGSGAASAGGAGLLDFAPDGRLVCATADGPRVC